MRPRCLMTASTLAHIAQFHEPYIKKFKELGWEIHVAGAGPVREILNADKVIPLCFEKSFVSLSNFRATHQLRALFRDNSYDLIICHTTLAAFFTRLASLGVKKGKLINVVHGYLFDDDTPVLKAMILKAAERLMAPATDMVLTMNHWDYKWAEKHKPAPKVRFIHGMGLDEQQLARDHKNNLSSLSEDDFVLVYAAEFSKRKNQSMLIHAMRYLPYKVKLVLPGEGALLDECKSLSRRYSLTDRVIFPGHITDIFSILCSADVAVSASRSEGLPFNILEAMAMGLPVIASEVKGNVDLVYNEVNGFTYQYNDERKFVAAVERLMDDNALCAAMGSEGKKMMAGYSLNEVLPVVMGEYLSLLT